jgi:hypothetical protein
MPIASIGRRHPAGELPAVNSFAAVTLRRLRTARLSETWEPYDDRQQNLVLPDRSPFVDSNETTIAVNGQVARLSGTIDSWSEREAAVKNAYDGETISVDNDLRVND